MSNVQLLGRELQLRDALETLLEVRLQNEQVGSQLPTYDDNVPLPALAAAERPPCWNRSISAGRRAGPTAANPPQRRAAAKWWDWRTDRRTDARKFHTPCSAHCANNVNTVTHTRLTALFPRLSGWASTRKVEPIWILLKQETVSGSGISWAVCKSAPHSRQITTPTPHRSVFYRPDALPAAQPTASKHWRQYCQYWLFQKCSFELAGTVTSILNKSFSTGTVPHQWLTAVVTPVPKKSNPTELSDYRPCHPYNVQTGREDFCPTMFEASLANGIARRSVSFSPDILTVAAVPWSILLRYDTIRDAILTCARKPSK